MVDNIASSVTSMVLHRREQYENNDIEREANHPHGINPLSITDCNSN